MANRVFISSLYISTLDLPCKNTKTHMKTYLRFYSQISILKTLFFNFKYFPIKYAIRFPVILSKRVFLREISGTLIIKCEIKPALIRIGFNNVGIFDEKRSRTIWQVSGTVTFEGRTNFGHGSKISVEKTGFLSIGENVTISAESSIVCVNRITIGKNSLLSWDILIMDTDFHKIYDKTGLQFNVSKPIIIGEKVWIGCRCLILKGVQIPNNSIIAANTTITKEIKGENLILGGNPIKILKSEVTWEI